MLHCHAQDALEGLAVAPQYTPVLQSETVLRREWKGRPASHGAPCEVNERVGKGRTDLAVGEGRGDA